MIKKLLLRIMSLLIILAVAYPIGAIVYAHYMPHLLLSKTTRDLYKYRTLNRGKGPVNLIPNIFHRGENADVVEEKLLAAGLEDWTSEMYSLPEGETHKQVFLLQAGMRYGSCSNDLFLRFVYNSEDRLQSATIQQGGACL